MFRRTTWLALSMLGAAIVAFLPAGRSAPPATKAKDEVATYSLMSQTDEQAMAKSAGCITCHKGIEPMHESKNVRLGCVDCHGGDANCLTKEGAHVHPKYPERWPTSANPKKTYSLLNREYPEFVRFINPGDWRVVHKTCGTSGCHEKDCEVSKRSMHGHSAMVPGTATYNNGISPLKVFAFGEIYGEDGRPQRAWSNPRVTPEETKYYGRLPMISPVPRFEIFPPGNIFRVLEINNNATSARGVGTDFRVDGGVINVLKTKLNDPTMVFLGTNDHCGDYRSSGCTACHVVYANDRDPRHAERFAKHGNRGYYAGNDPTIPKNESGHPIYHQMTSKIPSNQCVTCHFHQGSGGIANYYGYMWWDYETGADTIYPETLLPGLNANIGYPDKYTPAHGKGDQLDTHDLAPTVNPKLWGAKLADWHNAGWLYQAVYKRDRRGNMLDVNDKIIAEGEADWEKKAVLLSDVHLDKGMHCNDCHFKQDCHGDGYLYGAIVDPIEINCKDCHGTQTELANLKTSNRAGGNDLKLSRTPFGQRRFYEKDGQWYQRSSVTKDLEWPLKQVKNVVTKGHKDYNEQAAYAKTIRKDGKTWGPIGDDHCDLAHTEGSMTCYVCHSSWNTQCSGCHLDARTNVKTEMLHYEGEYSKVWATYNPDVLRNDGFMMARGGSVQGNRVSPVRSASGVIASARDGNRAIAAHQQPTISAEGHSGYAFTTNPPHTVRVKETKQCTDCHVADENDNNAILAKVFGMGTRSVDTFGRYAWVATGKAGITAQRVTVQEEFPEPIIGSEMHRIVDPESYEVHLAHDRVVNYKFNGIPRKKRKPSDSDDPDGYSHRHKSTHAQCIQRYGEWVLVADGPGGLRTFDIANIANKNQAQRIVESPLSPLGQSLRVKTRYATHVALASVLPIDTKRSMMPQNEEQPLHKIFKYCYVSDKYEGLILVDIHTLVDGNPSNNFFRRALTFNPNGILNGAVYTRIAGTYAYVLCDVGMVVVDISDPLCPKVCGKLTAPDLVCAKSIDIQFRYAFICDAEGMKVVDITHPCAPTLAAVTKLNDARDVKVMRAYAYVAAGVDGLAIIDVTTPTHPCDVQMFNADGCINDATAISFGATMASLYVYVADGRNGLRAICVGSPWNGTDIKGFNPLPRPQLLATMPTKGPAIAISEGMPRDRYVTETGDQISVFGRRGSRPFTREELERMYLRDGQLYTVSDKPKTEPLKAPPPPKKKEEKKPEEKKPADEK